MKKREGRLCVSSVWEMDSTGWSLAVATQPRFPGVLGRLPRSGVRACLRTGDKEDFRGTRAAPTASAQNDRLKSSL